MLVRCRRRRGSTSAESAIGGFEGETWVMVRLVLALLFAGLIARPARALRFVWTGSGQATIISAIADGAFAPTPSGSIHLGDPMTFALSFTTDHIEPGSAIDAD